MNRALKAVPDQPGKKKAQLRSISAGTRYDIAGGLRRLTRRIESGEIESLTDIIVISRKLASPDGRRSVEMFHLGTGTVEDVHWAISVAKSRIEPA